MRVDSSEDFSLEARLTPEGVLIQALRSPIMEIRDPEIILEVLKGSRLQAPGILDQNLRAT